MATKREIELIKKHEGFCETPYYCTQKKPTIGYGHLLPVGDHSGMIWSEDYAEFVLLQDIKTAEKIVAKIFGDTRLTGARYAVLVSMAFNLGFEGLSGFIRMIAAITVGDWKLAAAEALDSKWARQTKSRAIEIAEMLRTGKWPAWMRTKKEKGK